MVGPILGDASCTVSYVKDGPLVAKGIQVAECAPLSMYFNGREMDLSPSIEQTIPCKFQTGYGDGTGAYVTHRQWECSALIHTPQGMVPRPPTKPHVQAGVSAHNACQFLVAGSGESPSPTLSKSEVTSILGGLRYDGDERGDPWERESVRRPGLIPTSALSSPKQ